MFQRFHSKKPGGIVLAEWEDEQDDEDTSFDVDQKAGKKLATSIASASSAPSNVIADPNRRAAGSRIGLIPLGSAAPPSSSAASSSLPALSSKGSWTDKKDSSPPAPAVVTAAADSESEQEEYSIQEEDSVQEDFNQTHSEDEDEKPTPVKHRIPAAVGTKPSYGNQEHDDSSDSFLASRDDDLPPLKHSSGNQEHDEDSSARIKSTYEEPLKPQKSSAAPVSLFASSQKKPTAASTPPRKSHDADDYGDDFEDYGDDFEEGNNAAEKEEDEEVEEVGSDNGEEEDLSVGGMNQVS